MHLQRYLLKDEDKGIYFGDHFIDQSPLCKWYLGEYSIGLKKNNQSSAIYPDDFMTIDDTLLLSPSNRMVSLRDDLGFELSKHNLCGSMEKDSKKAEDLIQYLIEFIMSQEITHVFYSSEYKDGKRPRILTFSKTPPQEELYVQGKTMSVSSSDSEVS